MTHEPMIAAIAATLSGHSGLRALFLAGSHGDGTADAFSDIDFLGVVADGRAQDVAGAWIAAVTAQATPVMCRDMGAGAGRLVNIVTGDWLRLDLNAQPVGVLARHGRRRLRALHDPEDLLAGLPPEPPAIPVADRLPYLIEEFLRVIGLLPVAIGRGELVVGQTGVWHLRNLLIDLLKLETGPVRPRGALSLSRDLSPDRLAVVEGLALPDADRDSIIAANAAHARAFLPRARVLAARQRVAWPEAFEAATRRRWQNALGTSF